jgi:hypothetical protein
MRSRGPALSPSRTFFISLQDGVRIYPPTQRSHVSALCRRRISARERSGYPSPLC